MGLLSSAIGLVGGGKVLLQGLDKSLQFILLVYVVHKGNRVTHRLASHLPVYKPPYSYRYFHISQTNKLVTGLLRSLFQHRSFYKTGAPRTPSYFPAEKFDPPGCNLITDASLGIDRGIHAAQGGN